MLGEVLLHIFDHFLFAHTLVQRKTNFRPRISINRVPPFLGVLMMEKSLDTQTRFPVTQPDRSNPIEFPSGFKIGLVFGPQLADILKGEKRRRIGPNIDLIEIKSARVGRLHLFQRIKHGGHHPHHNQGRISPVCHGPG